MRRRTTSIYACVALLALAMGTLASRVKGSAAPGERRLGFTPAASARLRAIEHRYSSRISTSSIDGSHRALTKRPHRAGSDGAREVAQYLVRELEAAGLAVEVSEYLAYLSEPRSIRIEIVAPVAEPLAVDEPPDPRDPDSAHPEIGPGFIAYSPSADVTAQVVYVNYGLPADYAALRAAGVDVAGRIVLARYGRSHRAVKVFTAEQAGAAGVILYSDPADDGVRRGTTWPDGWWRAPEMLQRGNAKYSWFWHGDPLTPGVAATAAASSVSPESAPTLPKIPVAVLSAREAERIWRHGPSAAVVHLQVEMQSGRKPIRNVIGRLRGTADPDRWVIVGTHHDAWTFGGIDPGSSAAVLLEVARGLARLRRGGWQPARSVLFAFWDAEEYGLIGSTEFAEDRARELQERAVVYVNSDMYMRGRLVAGGVPSLRDFVAETVRDLHQSSAANPGAATSLAPVAPLAPLAPLAPVEELTTLGSGADFVAFQDHLGVPTLALEFLFEGGYGFGAYHSGYDSRHYVEQIADPGFIQGAVLARLLGTALIRLASADLLPFRYSHYAARIAAFLDEAERRAGEQNPRPSIAISTAAVRALCMDIAGRARRIELALDVQLAAGRVPVNARGINDLLARLDQTLLDTSQPVSQKWYRHVIYGWNIYSMYDGQPLPGLAEAIRVGDGGAIAREHNAIQQALLRMQRALETMEALLAAGGQRP